MMSSLNLLGSGRSLNAAEAPFLAKLERLLARDFHPLERMVRFDLLLHLRLDLLEIVGRDAVRQIDVVIKAVLDRRPGSELRFRPDPQDRRRQDVRRRMTETLEVGHLRALFESFAFFFHQGR